MNEITLIFNAEVEKTEKLLAERDVTIWLTQAARVWLAENGYDPKMGARPFERLFEEKIKRQLSKEILFGKLVNGGSATVDVADGEFSFTYREPSTSQFEIIAK